MKKKIAGLAVCAVMAIAPASAVAANADAPGHKINDACLASFGQIVSGGKSSGNAVHGNYAGGAKAFSADAILAAHGCSVNR